METILKKYRFLSDEQFGKMIKLSISYFSGGRIERQCGRPRIFWNLFQKRDKQYYSQQKKIKKVYEKKERTSKKWKIKDL